MVMNMRNTTILHRNQSGFASLVIAIIMIIVLSLLTLGFAQVSRREQKSALDKQLVNQAYFAAESGVNEVIKNLENLPDSPDTCLPDAVLASNGMSKSVNAASGVGYTCILVNSRPSNIVYGGVSAGGDRNTTFSVTSELDNFDVMWGATDNLNTPRPVGARTFPTSTAWGNSPAVLKVSITPIDEPFSRADLQNRTFNVYLYPQSSAPNNPVNYQAYSVANSQGRIHPERCNHGAPYPCQVRIQNLPAADSYLVRIHNYYDASNIQIGNPGGPGPTPIKFIGAQAVIDVTGKAQDVLRRIQVRSPFKESPISSDFGAEAADICKRLETQPTKTDYINTAGNPTTTATDPCYLN